MSIKILIFYLIPTLTSLAYMWYLLLTNAGRKITYYALLFLSIFIANIGYLTLSLSKNAEEALLATKFTYFSGTLVILFFIFCMLDVCNLKIKHSYIMALICLDTEVLISVFSAGYSKWHYKSVEFHHEDGISYLTKEYGPHHSIYLIMLIINMLIPVALIIYCSYRKNRVSWKYTMYFGVCQTIIIFTYFGEKLLHSRIDFIPLCFMVFEGVIVHIVKRSAKYDVSENVTISARDYKNVGHIVLSPHLDYMGCDGITEEVFPEIKEQKLDKKISIPFFRDKEKWILDSTRKPTEPQYVKINGADIKLQVQGFYTEVSKKLLGYIVRIIDDTTNQTYIRELQESTRLANEMAQKADFANRSKSEFLAQMSHEIRSPLNAILGFNEIISRESTEEAIKDYSKDISTSGVTLLRLLNDLLDLSKIEAGKMELVISEYDFALALNRVVTMANQRALQKGLKMIVDVDPTLPKTLIGDESRMMEILTNILINATKYTHEGSITVSVNYKKAPESKIVLDVSVKDTGIGMRPETIEHLFTPYERIDQMKNRFIEGTGLGMSITQKLLELMGSKLEVESIYGVGSNFHFSVLSDVADWTAVGDFEALGAKGFERPTAYKASVVAPNAHILAVDDTEVNLKVLKGLLKETKIKIDTATGGKEAVELCKKNKYDIIFIDHMMPDMDGVETLKAINNLPDALNKETPKIALTANVSYSSRTEYKNYGFTDYLGKPLSPPFLERQISTYLPKEKIK